MDINLNIKKFNGDQDKTKSWAGLEISEDQKQLKIFKYPKTISAQKFFDNCWGIPKRFLETDRANFLKHCVVKLSLVQLKYQQVIKNIALTEGSVYNCLKSKYFFRLQDSINLLSCCPLKTNTRVDLWIQQ